jgi:hypothetical protein
VSPKSRCQAWPLNLIFFPDPATSAPGRRESPGGETEADTARVGVARAFNLVGWLEDLLALAPRKTRSLVFDSYDDALGFGDQADGGASTIFHSIVDGFKTARRKAVGRPDIVAPRGPENVTGSPASEAFWRIPSTSALKSMGDLGSCFVSSRAKGSTDPIMSRIMSRSASIFFC